MTWGRNSAEHNPELVAPVRGLYSSWKHISWIFRPLAYNSPGKPTGTHWPMRYSEVWCPGREFSHQHPAYRDAADLHFKESHSTVSDEQGKY